MLEGHREPVIQGCHTVELGEENSRHSLCALRAPSSLIVFCLVQQMVQYLTSQFPQTARSSLLDFSYWPLPPPQKNKQRSKSHLIVRPVATDAPPRPHFLCRPPRQHRCSVDVYYAVHALYIVHCPQHFTFLECYSGTNANTHYTQYHLSSLTYVQVAAEGVKEFKCHIRGY